MPAHSFAESTADASEPDANATVAASQGRRDAEQERAIEGGVDRPKSRLPNPVLLRPAKRNDLTQQPDLHPEYHSRAFLRHLRHRGGVGMR